LWAARPARRPEPLERAAINARRGDYPHALAGYISVIGVRPNDAGVYFNRALSYRQSGKHDAALADLQKAVLLRND
jgi:tetratricopeptide (TPR) repeat protein